MRASKRSLARAAALSAALSFGGSAASADTVPIAADVTVNAANPDSNLNTITTRGGLLSGLDNVGSDYSFFLRFDLADVDLSQVTKVELVGTHTDDFAERDSFHQVYFVPDDGWSEVDVTWNTRPAYGAATAGGIEISGSTPGDEVRFDVTADVLREAGGDRTLSLAVATIDGRTEDLEFFASREFDAARAFRLETSTGGGVIAVPLPPAALPGMALLCIGGVGVWMRPRWLRA